MKINALLTLSAAALALTSCKNPADETASATVGTATAAAAGEGLKYTFTDESKIGFTGSKVTGAHHGGFKKFTGFFTVEEGSEVPNSGKVVIDMSSTWSDAEKLTGHLKSTDFFAIDSFPQSAFELTTIEKSSEQNYTVAGNFTLHGVTKNISFPAQVTTGEGSVSVKAEFDIDRKAFDINYPGKTDDLIRDEVVIRLDLKAKAE
jgi:polyisoprenoid-binding protein YceI